MITRNRSEPSRLHSGTQDFVFNARLQEEGKRLLRAAKSKMGASLGDEPSNPVLMLELLKAFVREAA